MGMDPPIQVRLSKWRLQADHVSRAIVLWPPILSDLSVVVVVELQ